MSKQKILGKRSTSLTKMFNLFVEIKEELWYCSREAVNCFILKLFWEIDLIKALRDQSHYQGKLSHHTIISSVTTWLYIVYFYHKPTMLSEKESQLGHIGAKRLRILHLWYGLPAHLVQPHKPLVGGGLGLVEFLLTLGQIQNSLFI